MLRKSKRPFIRISMVSAWAKKAVNPAALRGASLGYHSVRKRHKSNCPGAGRNLWYTGVLRRVLERFV